MTDYEQLVGETFEATCSRFWCEQMNKLARDTFRFPEGSSMYDAVCAFRNTAEGQWREFSGVEIKQLYEKQGWPKPVGGRSKRA